MRKTFGGFSAALLMMLAGATSPAWAAPESEQITVDGPYTVRQEQTKGSIGGEMGEQHLSVSQNVSYADLDLTKYADVETLRQRVRAAAKDSCRELGRRFPVSMYIPLTTDTCARDAARTGLAQVDAAAAKSVASAAPRQTLARQDTRPLQ
jgi:UrcA family protein